MRPSSEWVYQQLFELNNINLDGKILLDIGGGNAGIGFYFYKELKKYYCVDSYEGDGNPKDNYEKVLNKIDQDNIENMIIEKMRLKSFKEKNTKTHFDIIILSNSLHHIFKRPVEDSELNNFFSIVISLLKDNGILLIKESLPINLSQVFPKLNVDNVLWTDKFYPSFWLKPLKIDSTFSKISYNYQIPYKFKSIYPILKYFKLFRFFSSYISSSSYIIKAQK